MSDKEEKDESRALILHPRSQPHPLASSTIYDPEWRNQVQRVLLERSHFALTGEDSLVVRHRGLLDSTCDETLHRILTFLDGKSLCTLRLCSRLLYDICGNDAYWYDLCKSEWSVSPDELEQPPSSYLELYKYTSQSVHRLVREFFEEQCLHSLQSSLQLPRSAAMNILRSR